MKRLFEVLEMGACMLVFAVFATSLASDAMVHTSNPRQGKFS
ncbi:MAG TPA: hypothetical protein VE076_13570 [Nitrososphaeraceae archaeon]|jgi:hypothetical protein|nr:hypothetical protein [Nitrososphaeraceae archaeon]